MFKYITYQKYLVARVLLTYFSLHNIDGMYKKCKKIFDKFSYIGGKVTLFERILSITNCVMNTHYTYFYIKLGNQDKSFAPCIYCKMGCMMVIKFHQY